MRAKANGDTWTFVRQGGVNVGHLLTAVALAVLLNVLLHLVGLPGWLSATIANSPLIVLFSALAPRPQAEIRGGQLFLTYGRSLRRCRQGSAWQHDLRVPLLEATVYRGYEGAVVTMTWADDTLWTLPGNFALLLDPLREQFAKRGLPAFAVHRRPYVAYAPPEQRPELAAAR